ncbi:hypothetical protein HG531_002005 [Fusarium graminearum]|nr:hypothetical protein HG531_002005 [Fusarium graminearum]
MGFSLANYRPEDAVPCAALGGFDFRDVIAEGPRRSRGGLCVKSTTAGCLSETGDLDRRLSLTACVPGLADRSIPQASQQSKIRDVLNLGFAQVIRATALEGAASPLSSISNNPSDVFAWTRGGSSQTLARPSAGTRSTFFCSFSGQSTSLEWWYPRPSEASSLGEEALACVALENETLMFVSKLVPKSVELGIVRTMNNVRQLMEHSIYNIFDGHKLVAISSMPQAKAYLGSSIYIETYQWRLT